ncbi:hypothetical protein C4D60_Mb01t08140 [Musa balbisiana]|uniref:Uncharacterized protein n=1 Tax=Musa balbisiana TaxID=52838 RepID=A0A4S8JMQ1_MUSBA|nr:hypothetical protein C4D60_Mb01t08140 [Musa balbisiana]
MKQVILEAQAEVASSFPALVNLKCFYEFWIISFLFILEKGKNTLHQVETSIFCPYTSFVLLLGFSRGCKRYSKLILDLLRTARTITVSSSSSFRYTEGTVVHLPHELLRSWICATIDFLRTSRAGQTKVQTYGSQRYEPYKSLQVMRAHSEQSMHQSILCYLWTSPKAIRAISRKLTVIKCKGHIPCDLSGYDRIPLTST